MLADAVDWLDHYDWPTVGDALKRSLRGVTVRVGNDVAGSGRVVGDGVQYCYIQDVIVHPDHAETFVQ